MNIDEKATIGSILAALQIEGVRTGDVAKAIHGISEKPFREALKAAGYAFSNKKPKGWHFTEEGEEPLNRSIFDFVESNSSSVKKSSPNKKISSPTIHSDFTESNVEVITDSPIVHSQFTVDEVSMIKEMLYEWKMAFSQTAAAQIETETGPEIELSLHDRIKRLPQEDKTRKTIVISKSIGKQLDDFCNDERVNKSDVLHIALADFLEKYNS